MSSYTYSSGRKNGRTSNNGTESKPNNGISAGCLLVLASIIGVIAMIASAVH